MRWLVVLAALGCMGMAGFGQSPAATAGGGRGLPASAGSGEGWMRFADGQVGQMRQMAPNAKGGKTESCAGKNAATGQMDPNLLFRMPCNFADSFPLVAQNDAARFGVFGGERSKGKAEPIPTQWPNLKIEPIPTTWPNLKLLRIDGRNEKPAAAK